MEKTAISITAFDAEKYETGISAMARIDALKAFTIKSQYSIDREDIASILGFELPKKVSEDE
ncbi:hypothetical protein DS742_19365 [Lacrimispora amygdalina]|uniref:Uncharacterized protein n=1 Tax=Lacrimispora amygdalina TaxID=253257 RepID=A0A3E2N8M2_9FIRM|nr:hypothetical protein [Clostridium indicum]RFZ77348.1 hypothetical protein DS742_19365 [Clostridium indicum]